MISCKSRTVAFSPNSSGIVSARDFWQQLLFTSVIFFNYEPENTVFLYLLEIYLLLNPYLMFNSLIS